MIHQPILIRWAVLAAMLGLPAARGQEAAVIPAPRAARPAPDRKPGPQPAATERVAPAPIAPARVAPALVNRRQAARGIMGIQVGTDPHQIMLTPREAADRRLPDDEEEEGGAPAANFGGAFDLDAMDLAPSNFDVWLFGQGTTGEIIARRLAEKLEVRLWDEGFGLRPTGPKIEARLWEGGLGLGLTVEQWAKLELAGRGDIKHFLGRIEERREAFEQARTRFGAGRRVLLQLGPLAEEYKQGPFGASSLFAKTLRQIRQAPEPPTPPR